LQHEPEQGDGSELITQVGDAQAKPESLKRGIAQWTTDSDGLSHGLSHVADRSFFYVNSEGTFGVVANHHDVSLSHLINLQMLEIFCLGPRKWKREACSLKAGTFWPSEVTGLMVGYGRERLEELRRATTYIRA
jgi:hypothetical protein